MNQTAIDLDPLSSYEYPTYNSYPINTSQHVMNTSQHVINTSQHVINTSQHVINTSQHQINTSQQYPYDVKLEESLYYGHKILNNIGYSNTTTQKQLGSQPEINEQIKQVNEQTKQETTNDEQKPNVKNKKEKKAFCSKKITDASFPFYGCSVCNISYLSLNELDQHVTIHKDRMTSYRLRLRNQFKKKQIKKEKKKLKKLKKIKQEPELDIEIKPEDGYIGNDKAVDYNNIHNDNGTDNGTNNVPNNLNSVIVNGTDGKSDTNSDSKNAENTELNNMEKIYKCFACLKQFTLSYYLKLHVRSHTDEKPYTCSVCGQSFITASKLGRHNKRIHLAARFQCRICFKIFSRFELLTAHFDKHHAEDKLDGEPYDYNAILPYLKELEEQLKQQSEDKGQKPEGCLDSGMSMMPEDIKEEVQSQDEGVDVSTKIDVTGIEVNVEIKVEETKTPDDGFSGDEMPVDTTLGDGDDLKQDYDDDCKNEDFKDDSFSDEDYFPANTWASTPKCDPSPPPTSNPKPKKKDKMVKCEICYKEISSLSYMRIHMRTHTGEKPFKCCTCGRGFITSSKLNRHILTHDSDGVPSDKGAVKLVKEEIDEDGSPEETKSTKKKKKKSKKKRELNEEAKKKRQKRPHACEYCNQRFLHLNMLEVHKKSHDGEQLVLKCHFCLEEAIDMAALKEHETTHGGLKPYLCTICGRCYKKRETMVYHRKHHQSEQEFICDVCSKRFNEQGKLAKHLRTHTGEKFVLRYECPVCAHMFNTKYHVEMHLATHQKEGLIMESNRNEVLAMVLQNALKIPKQPDTTANLTDTTPSDERYCICKICGETFHHFYYLEEHLKSHGSKIAIDNTNQTEEKKYICEVCNKGFKLHYYLKLHSFTHSKEKPFICQQCGKGFITKGKLKRHLETHTGLKKYQCHICYKFFTRPSYLRIHIRTIHGNQDYNYRFDKNLPLRTMSTLTQLSGSPSSM